MNDEIFNFLTQEYNLILACTKEDFNAVKEVRRRVLLPKYSDVSIIEDEEAFLFNTDDVQSFIYLLQYQETKEYVGAVRVFFINHRTPIQALPMQKDGQVNDIDLYTKSYPIAEISRLALIKELPMHKSYSALKVRTLLTLKLMTATRINMFLYHYTYTFSIMELALHRILQRQKVNFKQIGESVDYYGICTPYAINTNILLTETEDTMSKMTNYYLKRLCKSPDTFWNFIDNNPYLERSDIQLNRICKLFQEYGDDVDILQILGKK